MKNYFILLLALISFSGSAQISFGARHTGPPKGLSEEVIENFKSTTTIFVLSDVLDISEYEKILKETWTVTPYKIIEYDDFNILELYKGNYSFATLNGYKTTKTTKMGSEVSSLHTYFDVGTFDVDEISSDLAKLSKRNKGKSIEELYKDKGQKIDKIFRSNKTSLAKFYLFPTYEFVETALDNGKGFFKVPKTKKERKERIKIIVKSIYSDEVFFNYTKGMLKNYFQKTNALIAEGETYWMYKKDFDAEKLSTLATTKLYIPDYITQKTNGWTAGISDRDEEEVEKLFKDYDYQYEFINKEDLDTAIASGKEFYYMRYVRVNAERFVQIVNSKTGDVVFRDYITGFSYNLKAKNIEYLSETIAKSKKKLAK